MGEGLQGGMVKDVGVEFQKEHVQEVRGTREHLRNSKQFQQMLHGIQE